MRCRACDCVMTTDEMVIRDETGNFEDLCKKCIHASQLGTEDTVEIEVEVGLIHRTYTWED